MKEKVANMSAAAGNTANELNAELRGLRQEVASARESEEEWRKQYKNLRQIYENQKEVLETLRTKHTSLQKENADISAMIKADGKEKDTLRECLAQNEALKAENQSLKEKQDKLEKEVDRYKVLLGRENSEVHRLKTELETMQLQVKGNDGAVPPNDATPEIEDLRKENARLKSKLDEISDFHKKENEMNDGILVHMNKEWQHATDEGFVNQLCDQYKTSTNEDLPILHEHNPQCKPKQAILFCLFRQPISLVDDIQACLSKQRENLQDGAKPVVVVLHYVKPTIMWKGKPSSEIVGEDQLIHLGVAMVVDCMFWHKNGLYECEKNTNSLEQVMRFYQNLYHNANDEM